MLTGGTSQITATNSQARELRTTLAQREREGEGGGDLHDMSSVWAATGTCRTYLEHQD